MNDNTQRIWRKQRKDRFPEEFRKRRNTLTESPNLKRIDNVWKKCKNRHKTMFSFLASHLHFTKKTLPEAQRTQGIASKT